MTSFLDELNAIRQHVRANASKVLEIPASGGRVGVKFRPPLPDDADARRRLSAIAVAYRLGDAISPATEKQLIIDCCDEILKKNEDGELARDGDTPLRFDASDERWGDDVKNAHECVAKLYNLDEQPLALAGQVDLLVDWLQGIETEFLVRVEGNSKSPEDASS